MIDGGPLRISRATTRQVSYRGESARRQPEAHEPMEPSMPTDQPQRAAQSRQVAQEREAPPKASDLGWLKWAVIGLLVAGIAVLGWLLWSSQRVPGVASAIDTSKYQAVFLSNGQVYFGKLELISDDYMRLTNIYYLERQLTANTDEEDETDIQNPTDNNFQLLKYSDVLYGSEDAMVISKDDVIRFENLRTDGVVAKAIANRQ